MQLDHLAGLVQLEGMETQVLEVILEQLVQVEELDLQVRNMQCYVHTVTLFSRMFVPELSLYDFIFG